MPGATHVIKVSWIPLVGTSFLIPYKLGGIINPYGGLLHSLFDLRENLNVLHKKGMKALHTSITSVKCVDLGTISNIITKDFVISCKMVLKNVYYHSVVS